MKTRALLSLFTLIFLSPHLVHADFPDVSQASEYYQSVSALQDLGIVQGYQNGEFDQSKFVTRAEFLKVALLSNMKSEKENYLRDPIFPGIEGLKIDLSCFPDVKASDWFAPYVCWAKEKKIIEGYADGKFHPENIVNMSEAAKIMARWKDDSIGGNWANGYFARFAPTGLPASIQSPTQTLNRADAAELIWRYNFATPEDIENKPGKIFVWDKDHFLHLFHIGIVYNYVEGHLYAKDDNKVYVMGFDPGDFIPVEIPNADPKSFKIATGKMNYGDDKDFTYDIALDDHSLYIRHEIVPQSSGGSFELLSDNTSDEYTGVIYAKDAERVYPIVCYEGCNLNNPYPKADLDTFEVLDFNYSKDKNHVYFIEGSFKGNNDPILLDADSKTFQSLGNGFARDKEHVFYLNNIVKFANPDSFKVFNPYYFASEGKVYYMDFNDEEKVDDLYSMDAYHEAKPIDEADSTSLEVYSKEIDIYYMSQIHAFAKDKNRVYYEGQALNNIDVATFHYTKPPDSSTTSGWSDKNGEYTFKQIEEMTVNN